MVKTRGPRSLQIPAPTQPNPLQPQLVHLKPVLGKDAKLTWKRKGFDYQVIIIAPTLCRSHEFLRKGTPVALGALNWEGRSWGQGQGEREQEVEETRVDGSWSVSGARDLPLVNDAVLFKKFCDGQVGFSWSWGYISGSYHLPQT